MFPIFVAPDLSRIVRGVRSPGPVNGVGGLVVLEHHVHAALHSFNQYGTFESSSLADVGVDPVIAHDTADAGESIAINGIKQHLLDAALGSSHIKDGG